MRIGPVGKFACTSGIERATVGVYEVKSCLADFKSGHGLNCVGDVNYIVCPYELMMQITGMELQGNLGQHDPRWGYAYPYPETHGRTPNIDELPKYEGQVDGWKLYFIAPDKAGQRPQPVFVYLWALICAGVKK